jgi:hypothetical protein
MRFLLKGTKKMRILKYNNMLIACKVVNGRPKAKLLEKAPEGVEVVEIMSGYGLTVANYEFSPYSYGPCTMSLRNIECKNAIVGEDGCVFNWFPNQYLGTIVYARPK